jgi:sugar phosphate isomerase/epimerase
MRALSLHHLVAPDVSAAELVRIAAALGCAHVSLFVQDPRAQFAFPVVADTDMSRLQAAMAETGVTAYGVASFALTPDLDVTGYEVAFDRGARLGATRANVRVLDPDEARATDRFGEFADLAARNGIRAGIEFMGFGVRDALPQAIRIVRAVGRGGVAVDALHLVRTGAVLQTLRGLAPSEISYVQLCDGPREATAELYSREGAFDRLAPGEGAFPLNELLDIVADDQPLCLEVPCERLRVEGVSAYERARRVVEATRRLLAGRQTVSTGPAGV